MIAKFDGVLYGQKFAGQAVMRIGLNIVRATLRVVRTAPRLSRVVRDATRVPNQRLHRTAAAQPAVAPRLPVSRGAVRPRMWISCRVRSDSHTLNEQAFGLFQLDESNIRIHQIRERDFVVSVRSLNEGAPEPVQVHDCHRVISALLISLNVGALGMFCWDQDPWVHPVLTVTDDFEGKNPRGAALVVQSDTTYEERKAIQDLDVMNAALVFGIVAREKSAVLTGEYCRGLLLLRMNFVELNFRREAFMCFYRALEHFVAVRILKVKRLSNELRDLQKGLAKLTDDRELIEELQTVYAIRSSQVAHSQIEQREITWDEVLKTKVFLDFVMHKEFKDEANRAMAERRAQSATPPGADEA